MFSYNSVVNTVSYSDGKNISYEEFIRNHNNEHQKNILISKTQAKESLSFINNWKEIGYNFFTGNNQDEYTHKMIEQASYEEQEVSNQKQKLNNQKQKLSNQKQKLSNQKQKLKNKKNADNKIDNKKKIENINYTIKYMTKSGNTYPFNKILKHLTKKFCNTEFKKSIKYDSFCVRFININGLDKHEKLLSIDVNIKYDNLVDRDIQHFGKQFEKYPINDYNDSVYFTLYHYKI